MTPADPILEPQAPKKKEVLFTPTPIQRALLLPYDSVGFNFQEVGLLKSLVNLQAQPRNVIP